MDEKTNQLLEDIKKLFVLALTEQNVRGKRIADVLDIDASIVSRILAPRDKKQDKKKRDKKGRQ